MSLYIELINKVNSETMILDIQGAMLNSGLKDIKLSMDVIIAYYCKLNEFKVDDAFGRIAFLMLRYIVCIQNSIYSVLPLHLKN